uniref:Dual specificity protein kinase shkD-like n=1 Tax=Phallusia mammillata TaxID=59560 RepID=A0A6F9D783_9ASCI|nr:dual specificity protein kinase shkD-like [Phallusia mammillata]
MLLWFCVYLVILIVPTMASFEDIQEIAAEDILCDPKSHRAGRGGNSNFIVGYYRVLQQIVAIKIYGVTDVIQDESLILKSVKKEIKHMQLARHDNVVQVFGFVKWLFHFGIVMEYCKAGDLRSFVFSPNVDLKTGLLIRILTEIAKGMAFLHNLTEKHLVHGNVKPENILLTKKLNIKISDFGNSKLVSLSKSLLKSKQLNTNFTPIYTAPEKLLAPDMEPTKELDVYAFAITTYVVLSRQLPFLREHWSKTTSAIIAGRRPDCKKITDWMLTLNSEDKKYIEIVKNLMTECWESDSNKRPCMSKVADKLQYLLDQQDQSALDQQVKNVATAFDFEKYDFFIEGQAFSLNLFSFSRQGYSIERNPHVLTHTWRNVRLLQKTFVASVPTESLKKPDASKSSAVAVTDLIDFSNGQHASATVGKGGGSLECDGCKVIIPPNALLNDVEIEISCLNKEKNVNLVSVV